MSVEEFLLNYLTQITPKIPFNKERGVATYHLTFKLACSHCLGRDKPPKSEWSNKNNHEKCHVCHGKNTMIWLSN